MKSIESMKKGMLTMACATVLGGCVSQDASVKQLVKFDVKPEKLESFKAAAIESLNGSLKEPGNVEMKLYEDVSNPKSIFVYSRWKDEDARVAHSDYPYSENIKKAAKEALRSAPMVLALGQSDVATNHTAKVAVDDKTVSLFITCKINDGYRDRVIAQLEKHAAASRLEAGNLLFDVYTVDGDEDTFVIYERWENEHALKVIHANQPYYKETGILLNEALATPMEEYLSFVSEIN